MVKYYTAYFVIEGSNFAQKIRTRCPDTWLSNVTFTLNCPVFVPFLFVFLYVFPSTSIHKHKQEKILFDLIKTLL